MSDEKKKKPNSPIVPYTETSGQENRSSMDI